MKPVRAAIWLPAVVLVLLLVGVTVASAADEDENLIRKTDIKPLNLPMISPDEAAGHAGNGVGPGQQGRQSTYCGSLGEAGRGVVDNDLTCVDALPAHDETPIAVKPANPQLLL